MRNQLIAINQTTGYLFIDIVNAYTKKYKNVVLMSSHIDTNIQNKLNNNVEINNIIAYNKSSKIKRIYTWGIATIQILWKLKTKYKHADLMIVSNPPFSTFLPIFVKNRFSFLIYDIYPDTLVNMNVLNEKCYIIKCWKCINRKIYSKAQNIFTISKGMAECLSQYVDISRITIIPIWADSSLKKIEPSENKFIQQHKLENKFIVLYSGNIGNTHNVDFLVDVAAQMINERDILFIIIGDGGKKRLIEEKIKGYKCSNVLLLPFQPYELLSDTLYAANIGVVTLNSEASSLSVPSKTYNLLNVGLPLLCIADKTSELGNLINKYNVGKIFSLSNIQEIKSYIINLKDNPNKLLDYKQNSLNASKYFSAKNAELFCE